MWSPKGTNSCKITSFEPLSVKIARKLWPVAPTKKRTDRQRDREISTNVEKSAKKFPQGVEMGKSVGVFDKAPSI